MPGVEVIFSTLPARRAFAGRWIRGAGFLRLNHLATQRDSLAPLTEEWVERGSPWIPCLRASWSFPCRELALFAQRPMRASEARIASQLLPDSEAPSRCGNGR